MDEMVQALGQREWLAWMWRPLVWLCAAYLLALGALMVLRPKIVHPFLDGFVRSRRINFLEAALRSLAGLAFMAVSPEMRLQSFFFWFGAVLAASGLLMVFLYDQHKRYAALVVPFARRALPAMGVCALAFAALIVWALR